MSDLDTTDLGALSALGVLARIADELDEIRRLLERQTSRSATTTEVSASSSTTRLLDPNPWRHTASIYNDSSATLYVSYQGLAGLDIWGVKVAAGGYFEIPAGYTGELDGIWDSASGSARVTEFA